MGEPCEQAGQSQSARCPNVERQLPVLKFSTVYPAATDADARSAFIRFDTDYNFGFAVHRLALNAARGRQKAWFLLLHLSGKIKILHWTRRMSRNRLTFLTGWFRPSQWGEPNDEDKNLADLMTGYWAQFAKTGDPNGTGLPPWPVYDHKTDMVQEIGHEVKQRPTPHTDRFAVYERILNRKLATIPRWGAASDTTPQK